MENLPKTSITVTPQLWERLVRASRYDLELKQILVDIAVDNIK